MCRSLLNPRLSRYGGGVQGYRRLLWGHRLGRGGISRLDHVGWLSAVRLRGIRRVHGRLHRRRSELRVPGTPRIVAPRERGVPGSGRPSSRLRLSFSLQREYHSPHSVETRTTPPTMPHTTADISTPV